MRNQSLKVPVGLIEPALCGFGRTLTMAAADVGREEAGV